MAPDPIWGERLPTLVGERVQLRWITAGDVDALFEVFADAEVTRYWSSPSLADRAAAERLLADIHAAFAERELFQWGIAARDGGPLLGTCTLRQLDERHRRAEIGFALARRAWGAGLASDALDTMLAFAFGALALERIEADVDPDNARSLRRLERAGFRREGLLRQRWRTHGEPRDAVVLGLLRTEWTRAARIEIAGECDIEELHRVRSSVVENRLSDPTRVQPRHYRELLANGGRMWKATVDGRIVGFAAADFVRSNVWALFVEPGAERRGVGRRLHDEMLAWMFERGVERAWLTTDVGTRAERFYRAAGWRARGLEPSGEMRFELTRGAARKS